MIYPTWEELKKSGKGGKVVFPHSAGGKSLDYPIDYHIVITPVKEKTDYDKFAAVYEEMQWISKQVEIPVLTAVQTETMGGINFKDLPLIMGGSGCGKSMYIEHVVPNSKKKVDLLPEPKSSWGERMKAKILLKNR